MHAYYNEIEPFAAAWLRELIKAGHIAPGKVDERSMRLPARGPGLGLKDMAEGGGFAPAAQQFVVKCEVSLPRAV